MVIEIVALKEAWEFFDGFPEDVRPEIARWVQERCREIRNGAPVNHSAAPRQSTDGFSHVVREPGEEG